MPNDQPLRDYIRRWLKEADVSGRELSRRAVDPETGRSVLSKSWLSDLLNLPNPPPPPLWRLRGLALAMGVPAEHLSRLAAREWYQLEIAEIPDGGEGNENTVAITIPEGLSEEARDRFIRIATETARHME